MNLKRLVLTNFKGIRSLDITFSDTTDISGQNATGKTTIADAYFWLLFDKNSQDVTDFEIKTLDENNQPYHHLDHEVTGWFDIDGQEISLRKAMREKWTKPRGQKEEVFDSHEKAYFWNEVPVKKGEFQKKISDLLDESIFKMITNPLYFNQQMKWQDRRAILIQMAGDIDNTDVLNLVGAGNDAAYKPLVELLLKGLKTPDEFKKEIAAKIKKIKDELILMPSRIDEANRSLPEPLDYDAILSQAETIEKQIADIDASLSDVSKEEKSYQQKIAQLLQDKADLNRQLMDIEFTEKEKVRASQQQRLSAINGVKTELSSITHQLTSNQSALQRLKTDKAKLTAEQASLRASWTKTNTSTLQFSDVDFCCPTCKRAFETTDIAAKKAELITNFNKNKSETMAANVSRGKAVGEEIRTLDAQIADLNATILASEERITALNDAVSNLETENVTLTTNEGREVQKALAVNTGYQKTLAAVASINEQVEAPRSDNGKSVLLQQKTGLNQQLKDLQHQLSTREQRMKIEARITELMKQESDMNQELATLEGTDYSIEQFTRAKMNMVESRVNELFGHVRFKMFEEQVNGGLAETCVALIGGVPFTDANTASRLNAGLDVIKTLSNHFGVWAPIFIDNRESVTRTIDMDSQVINLIVMDGVKKLKIQSARETASA